jgi:signal transduction histidine kinase
MSFRNRLALFLLVTLILVQGFTGFIVYTVVRNHGIEEGKHQLKAASDIFVRELGALSGRVSDAVEVLALDYPLRSAIAADDHETVLSALRNHGHRVGATRMMLVGLDGAIMADTSRPQAGSRSFALPALLQNAAQAQRGQGLAELDGRAYWLVAVEVRAPVPIAYIVAFLPVDDALAENLRALSPLPISVSFVAPRADGTWSVAARSAGHQPMVRLPPPGQPLAETAAVETSGDKEFLTLSAELPSVAGSRPIVAILDYPLASALAQFRTIIRSMTAVLGLGLTIALAGAMLIARGISHPLESLAAATRRIEAGDYSPPPVIGDGGEIGQLAQALAAMTRAISKRESDLAATMAALGLSRDEAVRANRAKSEFLANMSHELRTPLNAIMGFSEMMRTEVLGPLGSPRYVDYAGDIHGSGRHLLALIEDMLDLARVEAGKLAIARVRCEPAAVLEASLVMLRPMAVAAGVELEIQSAKPLPVLDADPVRLKQVFVNIIGNAIKFTPRGGRVNVINQSTPEGLEVRVRDTGIGMRAADIPLVIKPFHRLSSAFDAKYQGAGLGLPIAKAAVEMHGGRLEIASELGAGTTVTIVIPLCEPDKRRATPRAA